MPHNFLSVTKEGNSAIFTTIGNEYCHVILRGGKSKTNFDKESINLVAAKLDQANLPVRIMVDCSHANSRKDHKKQIEVANDIASQISTGEDRIIGIMIESNLVEGNQKVDDIDKCSILSLSDLRHKKMRKPKTFAFFYFSKLHIYR